jgi:hypothetical protein
MDKKTLLGIETMMNITSSCNTMFATFLMMPIVTLAQNDASVWNAPRHLQQGQAQTERALLRISTLGCANK